MFTIEQAHEILPVGTRVRHRYLDRVGVVAPRPEGKVDAGKVYDDDVSGWCVSVNVDWDGRGHLWTNVRQVARLDEEEVQLPDLFQAMADGLREFSKGLTQAQRTMQASGAMGLTYRGDLDGLRAALAALPPDQVREISTAAALLTSTADEVLSSMHPDGLKDQL